MIHGQFVASEAGTPTDGTAAILQLKDLIVVETFYPESIA